jgi:hypothetical protein
VVENAPVYYDVPGYDPSVLRDELAGQGAKLADEANAEMKQRGVQGAVVIAEGSSVDDVAEMVLAAATAFNADLLVMGTHGRKGFQRLILGSVAERCLRRATLPPGQTQCLDQERNKAPSGRAKAFSRDVLPPGGRSHRWDNFLVPDQNELKASEPCKPSTRPPFLCPAPPRATPLIARPAR